MRDLLSILQKKIEKIIGNELFSFLNHSKNYITAEILTKSISIITIPIFTRLLVPEDYGIIAVLSTFIAIFNIIFELGIRGSVVRYFYEGNNNFNSFFGTAATLIFTWGIFLSFLLYILRNLLLDVFQIPLPLLYIGIVIVFFNSFISIYESYLVASKNSKRVALITIIRRLIVIISSVALILVINEEKYFGKAYGMLLGGIILGAFCLNKIKGISQIGFNISHIKYILNFSFPIIIHLLSRFILSSFDKIIIIQLVGAKEIGLYALGYSVGMIQMMIVGGLLRTWTPEFYEKLKNNKISDLKKLLLKVSNIVYIFSLIFILFAQEIVQILSDKKYHEALDIVPIIVISGVFMFLYSLYVNFSFYYKKTKFIALATLLAGGINIGLNYWLIPIYGYKVAAWTTLVSYIFLFLFHYLNVRIILKPDWIISLNLILPNFFVLIGFVMFAYLLTTLLILPYIFIFLIKILLIISIIFVFFNKQMRRKLKAFS